jgi:hypothetical protein
MRKATPVCTGWPVCIMLHVLGCARCTLAAPRRSRSARGVLLAAESISHLCSVCKLTVSALDRGRWPEQSLSPSWLKRGSRADWLVFADCGLPHANPAGRSRSTQQNPRPGFWDGGSFLRAGTYASLSFQLAPQRRQVHRSFLMGRGILNSRMIAYTQHRLYFSWRTSIEPHCGQ